MKFRAARNHPWHLTRCTCCRDFVINSAPQCPGCGAWRKSARAMSFGIPILAAITGLTALALFAQAAIKIERLRAEDRAALLQTLAVAR